jgi:hypothetical protein
MAAQAAKVKFSLTEKSPTTSMKSASGCVLRNFPKRSRNFWKILCWRGWVKTKSDCSRAANQMRNFFPILIGFSGSLEKESKWRLKL